MMKVNILMWLEGYNFSHNSLILINFNINHFGSLFIKIFFTYLYINTVEMNLLSVCFNSFISPY